MNEELITVLEKQNKILKDIHDEIIYLRGDLEDFMKIIQFDSEGRIMVANVESIGD